MKIETTKFVIEVKEYSKETGWTLGYLCSRTKTQLTTASSKTNESVKTFVKQASAVKHIQRLNEKFENRFHMCVVPVQTISESLLTVIKQRGESTYSVEPEFCYNTGIDILKHMPDIEVTSTTNKIIHAYSGDIQNLYKLHSRCLFHGIDPQNMHITRNLDRSLLHLGKFKLIINFLSIAQ